jgi:curved DNA-binding protein CbpA
MAAINDAWDVLGNPARRAAYDRLLDADEPAPAPPTSPPPRHATAARAAEPADEGLDVEDEVGWVDHTADLRRFRMLMTAVVIVIGLVFLLVFAFIIWPETS